MFYMHCQIIVSDFAKWKASMEKDSAAMAEHGMKLIHLWRGVEESRMVFFVLEVEDLQRARLFMKPDEIAKAAAAVGASDFQWHFVELLT